MTSQRLRRTLVPGIDSWSVMFAVGLSIAGVLIHNLAEFPVSILLAPETLVSVGITMLLGAAMLHRPRRGVFMVAIAWAVVVIVIGGGSVLP